MSLQQDLEKIINSPGTKSDRARALFRLGCERTDVVELLGINYSQAHSVWKEMQNGAVSTGRTRKSRDQGSEGPSSIGTHPSRLNLRPAQTRYITQDGHEVLRDLDGTKCTECDRPIAFSLKYLGFIHENSKNEPTSLEDRYGG